ncbi:protein-disulfide reductase DsbD domain-containing protein [Aquibium microcysteis]|uniref:protein-disulfide reductase DsbD domain-containing protein n=1 Tax=Aquibium microcysteis TaxID=675281 RepID=UPI00165D2D58|nr:protein-disulfide reductase DsbD domain-containing protein [Aquibium microcysteis]
MTALRRFFRAAAAASLVSTAASAHASSSDPLVTEGATLRLVTAGLADGTGKLRGALEIRLDAGWKTYWKEPGASGVPPQIDVTDSINVSAAQFHFPAPEWHEDAYGAWAGYDETVVLPVTFTVDDPERFSAVEADLFLGICETICIPVQARLSVEPGMAPDDPADAVLVESAFASLPRTPDAALGVTAATREGDMLLVTVATPKGQADPATLFLAPGGGYVLGVPKPHEAPDGATIFEVPVLAAPSGAAEGTEMTYTLTHGDAAVSGTFILR